VAGEQASVIRHYYFVAYRGGVFMGARAEDAARSRELVPVVNEATLDIIVRAQSWRTPEELAVMPMMTPKSGMLPINELVEVVRTAGPDQLRRIDRRRTITLQVTPPDNVSLEQAIETLRTGIEPQVRNNLPADGDVLYSGAADKLEQALVNMSGSFVFAILILYLLMSALFRSFRDRLLRQAIRCRGSGFTLGRFALASAMSNGQIAPGQGIGDDRYHEQAGYRYRHPETPLQVRRIYRRHSRRDRE